nr:hypothetical protein [Tanacetum cinerariifolium]
MQAPLRNRFRDLPKADMKEILHQRMWESDSYKSHEDHMQLFEALEKSINHDHSEELAHDLAEAWKKRKKGSGPSGTSRAPTASGSQVTPPPPPPTSSNQDSPSKGSAAPSPSKTAAITEHQAWTTPNVTLKPLISLTPKDLDRDEAMGPDEQAQLSDEEDIESAHIPTTGDIAIFMDWFCKRRGITELKHQDLEGPAYEIVKVFHPDVIHLQYQMEECYKLMTDRVDDPILRHNVSKPLPLGGPLDKGGILSDAGLEQMVPYQFWIEEECKYDIAAMAVIFQDKYGVQMMMRFNEIYKFSDGTLQEIVEALDYRVKEFMINRMNLGLNTRFWTRKDVDRCNAFMFTIQRRLRTRRIFCNLESFVGGRVREGDYRLLRWQSAPASGHSKSKRTIKSRAKRSSKIISLGQDSTLLASSHTVKSKTDIKSPTHYPREVIVEISEFFRKFKFICHWVNPVKDFKWSNVPGVKLSLFYESNDTFTSLQALSNLHYLFSGFMNYFWSCARATGAALGIKSIWNFTWRTEGRPGSSSGKTFKNSLTTGYEAQSGFTLITSDDQNFTIDWDVDEFLVTNDFSMIFGQPIHTNNNVKTTELNRHKIKVSGQITHLVTSLTLDSVRSYVMQSAFLTQGMVSSIPTVFSWGDSISLDGFRPSILGTDGIYVGLVFLLVFLVFSMLAACVSRALVTLSATDCLMAA